MRHGRSACITSTIPAITRKDGEERIAAAGANRRCRRHAVDLRDEPLKAPQKNTEDHRKYRPKFSVFVLSCFSAFLGVLLCFCVAVFCGKRGVAMADRRTLILIATLAAGMNVAL